MCVNFRILQDSDYWFSNTDFQDFGTHTPFCFLFLKEAYAVYITFARLFLSLATLHFLHCISLAKQDFQDIRTPPPSSTYFLRHTRFVYITFVRLLLHLPLCTFCFEFYWQKQDIWAQKILPTVELYSGAIFQQWKKKKNLQTTLNLFLANP